MRTRKEIETEGTNAPIDGNENRFAAMLEVLLDIRELLADPSMGIAVAPVKCDGCGDEKGWHFDGCPQAPNYVKPAAARDPLFDDAKQAVVACGKASTSFLQRKLQIGYVKSALLMDQLEVHGVIGPKDGAKPRKVL